MPRLAELLERFRHAATPGPPAAAGRVPADAAADLQAELRPLIAALDEVEEEARALVDAARAEADALRESGARDAERVLDEARLEAARLRSLPPDEGTDDEEVRTVLARAEAEADGVRRRARSRQPGLVARVVSCAEAGAEPRAVPEGGVVTGVGRR